PEAVHCHAVGSADLRAAAGAAIARKAQNTSTGHCADNAGGVYFADAPAFRDIEVSRAIRRDARGAIDGGADGWPAIARVYDVAVSGYRCDDSRRAHFADTGVGSIRDIKVPRAVHGNPLGIVEHRAGSR